MAAVTKAELARAFELYGKAPGDGVTMPELTAVLTRATTQATPLSVPEVKRLFEAADTAGCGTVPCEVLSSLWSREPLDRSVLLQTTFDMVDFDQSGVLEVDEFLALSKAQDEMSVAMQKSVFELVDTSTDGKLQLSEFVRFNEQSGKALSDEEFAQQVSSWIRLAMDRTAINRTEMLKATFHWCDVNNDNVLEMSEFLNLSKARDKSSLDMQRAVFSLADTSGDGKLQEDEFVEFNLETGKALTDFDFAQQLRMWTKLAKLRA